MLPNSADVANFGNEFERAQVEPRRGLADPDAPAARCAAALRKRGRVRAALRHGRAHPRAARTFGGASFSLI